MRLPDIMLEADHSAPDEVFEKVEECYHCGATIHTGERYWLLFGDPTCEQCYEELVIEKEAE